MSAWQLLNFGLFRAIFRWGYRLTCGNRELTRTGQHQVPSGAHSSSGVASPSPRGGCVLLHDRPGWGGLSYWRPTHDCGIVPIQAIPGLMDRSRVRTLFDRLSGPIQQSAATFRKLPKLRREELMADVVATAYVAFARTIERG